ncbi:aminoglycoside 6'-N-acetyltransferase [Lysobacter arvi]|uniref:Aminoglycoside N(6')-acetyltransferase type 1 n=1 Tax=Lysobacter arvi TaxID=3038776 RepID=A0ABU1CEJ0_9GAMM|nr:aminoglycoside 6'-N-acetyltransferase [Lysobacter arvi]MDR0183069.1 GNAT family N-acetyltransferase [Lysobacter arvi]
MSAGGVRRAGAHDLAAWMQLRRALWPEADDTADALRAQLQCDDTAVWLAFDADGVAIGFAEASLRRDYVNGTQTSPVGFVEGLYVVETRRRSGVGRALVDAVERWTREHGCSELASDALIDNTVSHAAHRAYGFEETERVVYFRKPLSADGASR